MSSQFNDSKEDVTLNTRREPAERYPPDTDRVHRVGESKAADREVTLNTGVVLALFFALALLCAVFFGFGYSTGHKSAVSVAAAETDSAAPAESAASTPAPKPVAGSPVPEYVPSSAANRASSVSQGPATQPLAAAPATRAVALPPPDATTGRLPPVTRVTPPVAAATVSTPASSAVGTGTNYVQIAAVSHQEDADVLLSALRRRGYVVLTRADAADKLIHVQVGPFANRKEAEAMRQRLSGDGYNAFIK